MTSWSEPFQYHGTIMGLGFICTDETISIVLRLEDYSRERCHKYSHCIINA